MYYDISIWIYHFENMLFKSCRKSSINFQNVLGPKWHRSIFEYLIFRAIQIFAESQYSMYFKYIHFLFVFMLGEAYSYTLYWCVTYTDSAESVISECFVIFRQKVSRNTIRFDCQQRRSLAKLWEDTTKP